MRCLSHIILPAAVLLMSAAGVSGFGRGPVNAGPIPAGTATRDTVIYPTDSYKRHRIGNIEEEAARLDSLADELINDTSGADVPQLSTRDTLIPPDSLKYTDPFRYKYYAALIDPKVHTQVTDSLKASYESKLAIPDSLAALLDSLEWARIDSVYFADSAAVAKAEFLVWYNSLSKKEKKKYDTEQMYPILKARLDSIKLAKEDAKAIRDSIIEYTPRILETFAIPDSMQTKQIISWTLDPDFQKINVEIPDTTFNNHFYDYPFQKKDVNATWLGVAGSPLQYYNYFYRKSDEDVEFYKAFEAWSHSTRTLKHYNTKTPYTELSYTGTLLSTRSKESDNLHLFTTQNITPELNFNLLYERFGGLGMLDREETVNNNFTAQVNYLGKRYAGHIGYIRNVITRQENGGIDDVKWVRDTVVDARDMAINLKQAESKTVKNTFYLDQQLRIPFNFINEIKSRKDSTFVFNTDSLDRDITTAFIGHSSELSIYTRRYADMLGTDAEREFYNQISNYSRDASLDSMRVLRLDNKVFMKIQPWSSEAIVSQLNVGIGDKLENYVDQSTDTTMHYNRVSENSVYFYAGAGGQVKNNFYWNAKGNFTFAGDRVGDFGVDADARLDLYPFRRAKGSPLSVGARFETSLIRPNHYQTHLLTNHYAWDKDFRKESTTKVQASISIPYWKLYLDAGYALLANTVYYGADGRIRQSPRAVSVFTASLHKDLVLGPVHLDNRILFQSSSNQTVIPVPMLSLNLRYYVQFPVKKNVMEMQIGVNGYYNTKWYSPAYNPNLGVFFNQDEREYNNGPYLDAFVNIQWKRASIFIKYQNIGNGWPMKHPDYFSADRYIVTQSKLEGLKLGIFWPFYVLPGNGRSSHNHEATGGQRQGERNLNVAR
ncbi:MAG: putative porin [Bacteroidales bacterium]|nr:putative porin [Bacteroidales bacterium]